MTYHNKTYFGRKVRVILKTGEVFVDRFERSGNNYIVLQERGRFRRDEIKSWTMWHPMMEVHSGLKRAA